ncbi:MAG: TonB-dependent receptor [Myxococcota bacterium]
MPNRNVVFNVARTYEQLGRYQEAFRHYSDFLDLEPDAARREPAEKALERIRPKVALVRIVSDPPGAAVYVDRVDLGARGRTPRTLALSPGVHQILVEREGYERAAAATELVVGKEAVVQLPLARILGDVRVDGGPAGAEIRLDDERGAVLGVVPSTISVPPGPRVLVVTAPGHRPVRQLVQVEAKTETRTVVELPLVTGTLVVNAIERDALIEIDGQAAGFTPAVLPDVPAGKHRVRVTLAGYRPWEGEIEVGPDGQATIDVPLRPLQEVTAASRTAEDVEDAPASVSLIGAEEIRAFGYETLYEALAGTRGLYQTNDRTYEAIGVRGFSRLGDYGNRLLVTLDGHTLNDDQLGASYVGNDLLWDLEDLDRVEVVRGPGSALYGTNAFFGVVNLVPREGDRSVEAGVAASSVRQGRVRLASGVAWGDDGAVWASAGGVLAQGEDFVFAEYGDAGTSEGADRMGAAGAMVRARKGDVTAQVYANTRDKGIPTGAFETLLGDPRAKSVDTRSFGELRWEPELSERVSLYVRAYEDNYAFAGDYPYADEDGGVVKDRWSGAWAGGEARVLARPWDRLRLTAGGQADFHVAAELTGEDNAGSYLDESPRWQVYSGYAVADAEVADWLGASLGARADVFSSVGVSVNPRFAVLLHPGEAHTFKLLAGSAFRAPSPYELSYNDGGYTQIPAPDLTPETVRTGEVEYTVRFGDTTSGTVAAYYSEIDGLIDLVERDSGLLQYQNSPETVRTVGGELELRRAWRQGWMVALAQTLQRTRVGDLGGEAELTNSPPYLASLKAAAPILPSVTGATALRFEAPRLTTAGGQTDPALLWDLTLTGRAAALGVSWGLGVRNALDWVVTHPGGEDLRMEEVPQPGRTFFAEVGVAI